MKDKDKIIVITARCMDMTAYYDDMDKMPCSECGEMTWLSSSWRGRKIDKIVCGHCFEGEKYKKGDYSANVTEECLNNAIKTIKEHYGRKETDKELKKQAIEILERQIGKKINIIK